MVTVLSLHVRKWLKNVLNDKVFGLTTILIYLIHIFDRPGEAGAVLQTALRLNNCVNN